MKKLIIALLLVPGYAFSMRTSAPNTQSPKEVRALREELYTLQTAAAQAQAAPTNAQVRLQSIGSRLAQLTNDISRSKAQAIRQSIRTKVQNRKQGVSAQAQSTGLQEYDILEQELQQFANQLGSLIERSAKAASRHQARTQQSRLNRENTQQQQQQTTNGQEAVHPTVSRQVTQRKTTHAAQSSAQKQMTPQVYTIDYTKE